VVATYPLECVMDACLLVDSHLYRTGTSGIEGPEAPSVIKLLYETAFDLREYPATNGENPLLVVVSRFVEQLALESGEG